MKERLMTVRETLWQVMTGIYTVFVMPLLFIMGLIFALMLTSASETSAEKNESILGVLFFWGPMFITVILWARGVRLRRNQLKKIVRLLKSQPYFSPVDEYHEVVNGSGVYFGIDTRNGTMLYVRLIRKGVVDILGLTLGDLTRREVEGKSKLRLYTRFTDPPCIEVRTAYGQRYFDMIGAMECKSYRTPLPFAEYVNDHIMDIERTFRVRRLAIS